MRLVMLFIVCACAHPRSPASVELVETIPVECTLARVAPDAADTWLAMINEARQSIDLAEFYASNAPHSRLEPIVAALEAALHRGVRVRFLAEHSFVKVYPDTLARLAKAGAVVRELDLSATTYGILHAKYFIVDGRDAVFGSQNFDWRAIEHNYELGARVRDPAIVAGLAAVFARDWAQAGGEPLPNDRAPASAFVASPKSMLPDGIAWDVPALIAAIDSARTSIAVQLLTYRAGDWTELEAPLLRAAGRGVHVQLMVADWSKRKGTLPGLLQLARTPNVAIKFVTFPLAAQGFIPFARVTHAKLLVVDGTHGWLGTGNWEKEYFYASRNVGLVISDPAIADQLARFFRTLWDSPYASPVDPDGQYEPPRIDH
jgi:phosphatidylserine/phosphatidylglycerophosphate/cardiolipin synthase-like enzyme